MNVEAVFDNDVLIKAACYSFLDELADLFGGGPSIGILGAARFVVNNRLNRGADICNVDAAKEAFAAFLESAVRLEPTNAELALATTIEEAAMLDGLPLDGGESHLCAIALSRSIRLLLTGDKRAIASLESIKGRLGPLYLLERRVACLEQSIAAIIDRIGLSECRAKICAEARIDKALSLCFSCGRLEMPQGSGVDGLASYIDHVRRTAPTILCEGYKVAV